MSLLGCGRQRGLRLYQPKQWGSTSHVCISEWCCFFRPTGCSSALGMRLYKHKFLMPVGGRNVPTACSRWLRWWVYFGGRGAAWLHCYGWETNMPFVRTQEEPAYELRLTRMLWRLWRSILSGDTAENLIALHVHLCCFDYSFPAAWDFTLCSHFWGSSDFEHRFRESTTTSSIFVPWHCVEAFLIFVQDRARFYVFVNYLEWRDSKRIVHCWCRLLPSLRTISIGCSRVASRRLFSQLQGANLLSVLRCISYELLPMEYSVPIALMIAFKFRNHFWSHCVRPLYILATSLTSRKWSATIYIIGRPSSWPEKRWKL